VGNAFQAEREAINDLAANSVAELN
jgi:hypothetical protein